MAQEYTEYIAEQVLNEHVPTTYRNVSRALKVHCNPAKQMLYEFHRKQNSKKPGSVHATYLLSGVKREATGESTQSQQDEDSVMQSSPGLPSSSFPVDPNVEHRPTPTKSIMLVREEHLEQAKTKFQQITGIHIYSLQAQGLSDYQILTDCNRRIALDHAKEDPLTAWKQYGSIQNPSAHRRTTRSAPPAPLPAAVAAPQATTKPTTATKSAATAPTTNPTAATNNAPTSRRTNTPTTAPTAPKRETSNIFKSFAKTPAPKPSGTKPQLKPEQSTTTNAGGDDDDDVPMTGFSSDEDDDGNDLPPELAEVAAPKDEAGKSRREREEELRAMMDAEDEPAVETGGYGDEDEVMADGEDGEVGTEDADEAQGEVKGGEDGNEEKVEGGRRRGRRRVMKKKTVKDEEGYLVTREEAVWESFSEDEPAPKKVKTPAGAAPATTTTSADKSGGTIGKTQAKKVKPGQGNIMSFFAKK